MRKWKVLFALLAVALVVPAGFGQTQEDLLRKLDSLDKRMKRVEAENAQLKDQLVDNDDVLETQVNALLERYTATTVNSVANPVTLTGELRFRNTWTTGDQGDVYGTGIFGPNPEELDGSWNDALVRLGFMYEFTRDVTAYVELQSHWTFGDFTSATGSNFGSPFNSNVGNPPSNPNFYGSGEVNSNVAMYEAWIEVRNVFNQPQFSTKTGRQEIVLGNQFQFGNADWFSGWSFDGTVWTWDDESFRIIAVFAKLTSLDFDLNQVPSYQGFGGGRHDDDELWSIYFTLKTIKDHELDLYWIFVNGHGKFVTSVGSQGHSVGGAGFGSNAYYHTFGGRIGGEFPDIVQGLDWNVEFAYQTGDINGNAVVTDIGAIALEAEVGVTFDRDNKFRGFIRFLWAEGPDGDEAGYTPLYANRHSNSGFRARYGLFDLIPMTNVVTLQGGVSFDPDPAWTLGATVLWATADEEGTLAPAGVTGFDDDYGWEIDVWGEYRYSEQLTMGAGVAFMFADDEGQALWGVDDDTLILFYLQARLVF